MSLTRSIGLFSWGEETGSFEVVSLFCNFLVPSFCVCSQVAFLSLEVVVLMSCALWHCCACIAYNAVCFELEPIYVVGKLPALESGFPCSFFEFS